MNLVTIDVVKNIPWLFDHNDCPWAGYPGVKDALQKMGKDENKLTFTFT